MISNKTSLDNTTSYNGVIHTNHSNGTMNRRISENMIWEERHIIFVSAFVAIFIIGVAGNLLVCYIFNIKKKRLSTMEKLIFRLGVVDLFASILNPVLFIYWQVTHNKVWHFGHVGCKIIPSLNYFTDSVSIGIIVIIAIDRARKICQPMRLPYTMGQINKGFILIICGGVVMEIPRLIHAKVYPNYSCTVYKTRDPSFAYPSLSLLILRDVACTSIFAFVFVRMYKVLYKCNTILTSPEKNKKRRKAYVLLVAMTTVFILLVYPRDFLHIIYISLNLAPINYRPPAAVIHINTVLKIMRASNSIVNVFIYAGFHSGFRRKLQRMPSVLARKPAYHARNKADNSSPLDQSAASISQEKQEQPRTMLSVYTPNRNRFARSNIRGNRKPKMSVPLFI